MLTKLVDDAIYDLLVTVRAVLLPPENTRIIRKILKLY